MNRPSLKQWILSNGLCYMTYLLEMVGKFRTPSLCIIHVKWSKHFIWNITCRPNTTAVYSTIPPQCNSGSVRDVLLCSMQYHVTPFRGVSGGSPSCFHGTWCTFCLLANTFKSKRARLISLLMFSFFSLRKVCANLTFIRRKYIPSHSLSCVRHIIQCSGSLCWLRASSQRNNRG